MRGDRLTKLYDEVNTRYFAGELPPYSVVQDFGGDVDGWCDVSRNTIHLHRSLRGAEVRQVLIHEMVHLRTGKKHDASFLAELRRIAGQGEPAAGAEADLFEKRARIAQVTQDLLTARPGLKWAEARRIVANCVGLSPDNVLLIPARLIWEGKTTPRRRGERELY